ncbi:MAG: hypothetical protein K0Q72_1544 [Armatimonadetes bacterium]|jgi:hypothetical protein|nr:hypothetical protein [Armatimonadota bacterium]
MIPGPDKVIACPLCQGLAKYGTLLSGNTFGQRFWTDGKREVPMLPRPPAVVACRHCGGNYWLQDAEEIGDIDLGDMQWEEDPLADIAVPAEWRSVEYVEEPSVAGYYAAIRDGFAKDSRQERALRIFAWWRGNDAFREDYAAVGGDGAISEALRDELPDASARETLLRELLPLLDTESDQDRILRGEILRELGRWDEATEVLRAIRTPAFAPAVKQLLALCQAEDAVLRELKFR